MVNIRQGDVCWVDFPSPMGSGPGFQRPAVVIQSNAFNRSKLATTFCIPLTSNLKWQDAAGNVLLKKGETALEKDSVAVVSQIVAVDKSLISKQVGTLSKLKLNAVLDGLSIAVAT